MSRLSLSWSVLEPPRTPVAVMASGIAARRLAAAVLERPAAAALRVAASEATLLVFGEEDRLPWADGACYLGREDGLLLPTTSAPSVPADLLRAALGPTADGQELAVVPDRVLVFARPSGLPDPTWLSAYAGAAGR